MISRIDNNSGLEFLNIIFKKIKNLNIVCTKLGKIIVIPFVIINYLYSVFLGLILCLVIFLLNIIFVDKFKNIRYKLNKLYNDLFFR